MPDTDANQSQTKSSGVPSRLRRLGLIWKMLQEGEVTIGKLRSRLTDDGEPLSNVNATSLADDVHALRSAFSVGIGHTVNPERGEDLYFITSGVYVPSYALATKLQRQELFLERKAQVSKLAGGLLLGRADYSALLPDVPPDSWPLAVKEVQRLLGLNLPSVLANVSRIWETFQDHIWSRNGFCLALDAGTTTEHFGANVLAKLSIPSDGLNLLEVCTNSRGIFNILGDPKIPVQAIVTGGMQQSQTESLSGDLSVRSLAGMNLKFAAAFVGTTAINLREGKLYADQRQDATIKNKLLDLAAARIVMCDHSKLSMAPSTGHVAFASLDPRSIDLIIVDAISSSDLKRMNDLRIPVLTSEVYS